MVLRDETPAEALKVMLFVVGWSTTFVLATGFCAVASYSGTGPMSGHILSHDMDQDGVADYWQQLDDTGRVVEVSFGGLTGQPNEVVPLDDIAPREVPHFIIALDGVPYDCVKTLRREGRFRLFHPPSRVVTCFPGMTDPAFQRVFGGRRPVAFENQYYDRSTVRWVSGYDGHMTGRNADWASVLDYRSALELDAMAYMRPQQVFDREVREAEAMLLEATTGTRIVYCVATAGLGTMGGREAIEGYLRSMDDLCERVVYGRRGRVKITLLADHGRTASGKGRVSFKTLLESSGHRVGHSLVGAEDVVAVEFGLVTYAALYTDAPEKVSKTLLKDPRVLLVFYRTGCGGADAEGAGVVAESADGRAVIRKSSDRYIYEVERADPLELESIIEGLRREGKVDSGGLIDDRAMFLATVDHIYPDPLRRVWLAFNGLVEQPAELIVCLKPGWVHGSPVFYSTVGRIASTHGSLTQSDSVTFAMTMMGPLPPAMRLEEVMPAIEGSFRK